MLIRLGALALLFASFLCPLPGGQSHAIAPLLALLIGAGLGAVKGLGEKEAEEKGWKLKAATTRYSPWTKMEAPDPKRADMMGSIVGGATGGLMMGQGGIGGLFGGGAPNQLPVQNIGVEDYMGANNAWLRMPSMRGGGMLS